MKNLLTIALFLAGLTAVSAQENTLYYSTWKVDAYLSVFQDDTIVFYDRAQSGNLLDFSKVEFSFTPDGNYTGSNNDGEESSGTCVFDLEKDSIFIDGNGFAFSLEDENHFISKGFSMELADVEGNLDSSFNYLVLYRLATVTGNTGSESHMAYVNIFPNPAGQQLSIEIPASLPALQEVRILNMYGQEVYQNTNIHQSKLVISTIHLPVGLYVVEIMDQSGNTVSRKVAKQ